MRIEKELNFGLGDQVFFLHQNAVLHGTVKAVVLEMAENTSDAITYGVMPDVEGKVEDQMLPAAYVPATRAFATKEELLASL